MPKVNAYTQYYQIVKFTQKSPGGYVVRGYGRLTLEEARRVCSDPETSSKTASTACRNDPILIEKWHNKQKHWFYGFRSI